MKNSIHILYTIKVVIVDDRFLSDIEKLLHREPDGVSDDIGTDEYIGETPFDQPTELEFVFVQKPSFLNAYDKLKARAKKVSYILNIEKEIIRYEKE